MSPWIVLVTLLALLFYFFTGLNAARTRGKHSIPAPAMSGHPEVERALRVQGNSLEWIVIFLPALWLWAVYLDPRIGALLGLVWILGRVLYQTGYMKEASKRSTGFLIQLVAVFILWLGAVVGAVAQMLQHPLPTQFF
jgi:glutathione S-transferase